jgi:hypothetical protein
VIRILRRPPHRFSDSRRDRQSSTFVLPQRVRVRAAHGADAAVAREDTPDRCAASIRGRTHRRKGQAQPRHACASGQRHGSNRTQGWIRLPAHRVLHTRFNATPPLSS